MQKYLKVEFFIGSLLKMFKANNFDRDRCRTFIVQFPCRKVKSFCLFESFQKKLLLDLKVENIAFASLLRQSLDDP